jgi:hypothetical protein
MARYFNFFPRTPYYKGVNSSSLDELTNITARFGFQADLKNNAAAYYNYLVKDGDTPEIIASKIYGSPERHWIVLSMNDITDPLYQWPLTQRTIIKFINKKYESNVYADTANTGVSGVSWATNNIHSYYKVVSKINNTLKLKTYRKVNVDVNTYSLIVATSNNFTLQDGVNLTIETSKETKTYYDREIELNENRRKIILLKPEFVPEVESEFLRVIKDTL